MHRIDKIRNVNLGSVHNKFEYFGFSAALCLEVINTPGTEDVLGSNLTVSVFFFKFVGLLFVSLIFVGLIATSSSVSFLLYAIFISIDYIDVDLVCFLFFFVRLNFFILLKSYGFFLSVL